METTSLLPPDIKPLPLDFIEGGQVRGFIFTQLKNQLKNLTK